MSLSVIKAWNLSVNGWANCCTGGLPSSFTFSWPWWRVTTDSCASRRNARRLLRLLLSLSSSVPPDVLECRSPTRHLCSKLNNYHAWSKLAALLDCLAFFFSLPASIPPPVNPQKHQLQRDLCYLFIHAGISWAALYVTYVFHLSPCLLIWKHNYCLSYLRDASPSF